MARSTLHGRLLRVLAAFTLATTALFATVALIFMLELDDAHMAQRLDAEARWLIQQRGGDEQWPTPRDSTIRLARSSAELPQDVSVLLQREPERVEFPGEGGSHYHLKALSPSGAGPWLVLDAGSTLIVRHWWIDVLATFLVLGVALCIAALAAADRVARRTTTPLTELARQIEATDPLVPPEAVDGTEASDREVAQVASGVNRLLDRVNELIRRERQFTRDASHELRTPLAAIRSAAEQLAADSALPGEARSLGETIGRSSRHLGRTVETLLRLARDEEHDDRPSTCVLPVLERVVLDLAVLGDDEGIATLVDVRPSARVALPRDVLALLLANLLTNAYRHGVGGEVRIDDQEGCLRLRNSASPDRGMAIRSDRAGFGLEIAHRLCLRHGVELSVRIGDGTAEVSLPLSGPADP